MHIYSVSVDQRCGHCDQPVHRDLDVWAISPSDAADMVKSYPDTIKVWDVTFWEGETEYLYRPDGTLEGRW